MMKSKTLSVAVATALLGVALPATALELFVDTKTGQVYTTPGKGRTRLGEFQKVDETTPKTTPAEVKELEASLDKKKAELEAIEKRLDKKKDSIKAVERKIDTVAAAAPSSSEKKWYDKISLGGYTQMRYTQMIDGDNKNDNLGLVSPTDRSIGNNTDFLFRRVRLKASGDVSDWLGLYMQVDLSGGLSGIDGTNNDNTDTTNFAQIRDAYADVYLDKKKEFRARVGQSKVPFGWENLQSSQNRVSFERADALNSAAVRDERDLGIFAMWTPEVAQQRFKYLQKSGLKGSGDYGVAAFGVYNGAGANRFEFNDQMYLAGRLSYPFELPGNQMLEVGMSGYSGRYFNTPTTVTYDKSFCPPKATDCSFTPTSNAPAPGSTTSASSINAKEKGFQDERGAIHAVLYPKPFGLQTEWSWGKGPELSMNLAQQTGIIDIAPNFGGYVMAMYKIDHWHGSWVPYAKWQTYDGGSKFDQNSPRMKVDEFEAGIEWQPMPELELTAAYSHMNRTNVSLRNSTTLNDPKEKPYSQFAADILRMQLQWNY